MLSMYVDANQKNRDEILLFVTFVYSAEYETIGFTPYHLLYIDYKLGRYLDDVDDSLCILYPLFSR